MFLTGAPMEPLHSMGDSAWSRLRSRRDVLKLGVGMAAGGAFAPLLAACMSPVAPSRSPLVSSTTGASPALAGSITVLIGGGADPSVHAPLKQVYDDFMALHPGIEWDIRALPTPASEGDRIARAAIAAGEPVGLMVINGQQVRSWVRDGLLADLGADPEMSTVLGRIPGRVHLPGPGETTARAVPLGVTRGIHASGMYYNKAILDQAGLQVPKTFSELEAAVKPLSALGVAPLVHCSGDVQWNQMLITWVLPMIAERTGDAIEFAERTINGDVRYDSPEWIEAFQLISNLRTSGVLMEGSGAVDYATMQQLLLQGRAAMTYNGSWLLSQLLAGSPTGDFDLHVAPPPGIDAAARPRPSLHWNGFALPAEAADSRDSVYAFLEYASRPEVDEDVVAGMQAYSPIAASNDAIANEVAQEFIPMLDDGIMPLDWLWEPEITAEIDNQVQALVKGDTDAASAGKAIQAVAEDLRSSGRSYYP
jgi:arabinogalactan oligomer/maltooligosaccharide transport system substrate-binding protein